MIYLTFKLSTEFLRFRGSSELILQEAVALVTGGASGLGKATVQHLLKHGFKVAMLDLPSSNGCYLSNLINRDCLFLPANVIHFLPKTLLQVFKFLIWYFKGMGFLCRQVL